MTDFSPQPRASGSFYRRLTIAAIVVVAMLLGALFIACGAIVTRSTAPIPTLEVTAPSQLSPGKTYSLHVRVRDAKTAAPLSGLTLQANLRETAQGQGVTDAQGVAVIPLQIPASAPAVYRRLEVAVVSGRNQVQTTLGVTVSAAWSTYLSTDKPLYQPGQLIHIRSLSLSTTDRIPARGQPITLEVKDPKGTRVFSRTAAASEFGILSADFELADEVILGRYTVRATLLNTSVERSVEVARYNLPRFKVQLESDKGYWSPGGHATGLIKARYTFGEPVALAPVTLQLDPKQPAAQGKTDANGEWRFDVLLPNRVGKLPVRATVEGPGEESQSANASWVLAEKTLTVEAIPEQGRLIPEVENIVYIAAALPDGAPAVGAKIHLDETDAANPGAAAQVHLEGGAEPVTSKLGIAKILLTPTPATLSLKFKAEDQEGRTGTATVALETQTRGRYGLEKGTPLRYQGLLVRPERRLYRTGERLRVQVLSPNQGQDEAQVEVLRGGEPLAAARSGPARGRWDVLIDLPPTAFGALEVRASLLGSPLRTELPCWILVQRSDDLAVEVRPDHDLYRPAQKALLDVEVRTAQGTPTPAALGVLGVDEAVYALSEDRPNAAPLFFNLASLRKQTTRAIDAAQEELLVAEDPALEDSRALSLAKLSQAGRGTSVSSLTPAQAIGQVERAVKAATAKLGGWSSIVTIALAAALCWLLGYFAILRLKKEAEPAVHNEAEKTQLRRATRGMMLWWILTILVPAPLTIGTSLLGERLGFRSREGELFGAFELLLLAMLCALMLARAARRISTASQDLVARYLRTVAWILPVLCLLLYVPVAILVSTKMRWAEAISRNQELWIAVLLVALLSSQVALGFVSIVRQSALRKVSRWRGLWLFLSRPVFVGLPLTVLGLVSAVKGARFEPARAYDYDYDYEQTKVYDNKEGGTGTRAKGEQGSRSAPTATDTAKSGPAGAAKSDVGAEEVTVRKEFPETLLWMPEVVTDATGRVRLEVPLADSITTWRLSTSAVSGTGQLGTTTTPLKVMQDLFVDANVPVAVTRGDEVTIPVAVYNYQNNSDKVRVESVKGEGYSVVGAPTQTLEVASGEVRSTTFRVRAERVGKQALTFKALSPTGGDAVERSVLVEPDGQRVEREYNGLIEGQKTVQVTIPPEALEGTIEGIVKVYPDTLAQVAEGMEGIFRTPSGCFEQTSSTTYPNVLALDFLRRAGASNSALEAKATRFIGLGYQRLLSFEIAGGGFDWFGQAPANNILSAYGLAEFHDMAKVYPIDPAVLSRTRDWLLKDQQSDGTWKTPSHLASSAVGSTSNTMLTTAYIAWALARSGGTGSGLDKALAYVEKGIGDRSDSDPYVQVIRALALLAGGRRPAADRLIDALVGAVAKGEKEEPWKSGVDGVTCNRGRSLGAELSALAAYAMIQAGLHKDVSLRVLQWLSSTRSRDGTWGSTQATVAAMRALLAEVRKAPTGQQVIRVSLDDKSMGEVLVPPGAKNVLYTLPLKDIARGTHALAFQLEGGGAVDYQIATSWYQAWERQKRAQGSMQLTVECDGSKIKVGGTLRCRSKVNWQRPEPAKMVLIELGIPPGFEMVASELDKAVRLGKLQRYSTAARKATLYLSEVQRDKPATVEYSLRALFPVRVKVPFSQAWPYYEPEQLAQTEPFKVEAL